MAKQRIINSKLLKHVGSAIKERRNSLSLSQEILAELSDLHTTTISDIERGKSNLTLISLESIASALKCSEADLLPENQIKDKEINELILNIIAVQETLSSNERRKLTIIIKGVIEAFG